MKHFKNIDLLKKNKHKGLMTENNRDKIQYLESLMSKQLELYNWCEEKVSTLATIDSILLGAVTLFLDKIIGSLTMSNLYSILIKIIIILTVMLPLFISLAIALWHIRPKMGKSSNYGRPNHRSSNGIRHFENSEEYSTSLSNINNDELCEDLIKQIYGMNKNIWINQKSIKTAVIFDLVGLSGFFIMIIIWVIL